MLPGQHISPHGHGRRIGGHRKFIQVLGGRAGQGLFLQGQAVHIFLKSHEELIVHEARGAWIVQRKVSSVHDEVVRRSGGLGRGHVRGADAELRAVCVGQMAVVKQHRHFVQAQTAELGAHDAGGLAWPCQAGGHTPHRGQRGRHHLAQQGELAIADFGFKCGFGVIGRAKAFGVQKAQMGQVQQVLVQAHITGLQTQITL